MLEPTEPIEGSEPNTPSDTLPPRRRRRAASRPAGPPAAAENSTAETVTPAIPAAEPVETPQAAESGTDAQQETGAPAPRRRQIGRAHV